MTLSQCIEEYVRHRRYLGVCFHGEQVRLRAFVKSVGDLALADVTPEAVRRYIDGKRPVTQGWFYRFYTVAGFYRFAMARQYTDYAPLPPRPPKPPAEFVPYIHSEQDVRALLTPHDCQAVSSRPASSSTWSPTCQQWCASIWRASPLHRVSCPYAPPAGCGPPPLAPRHFR